jgi:hypothetical protein
LRRQEQNLADAILRKDAEALDRLVGHEYTLRVGDVPQSPGGLPRAIWMANALNSGRTKAESVDLRDCVARRLADDLAVVQPDSRSESDDRRARFLWRLLRGGFLEAT